MHFFGNNKTQKSPNIKAIQKHLSGMGLSGLHIEQKTDGAWIISIEITRDDDPENIEKEIRARLEKKFNLSQNEISILLTRHAPAPALPKTDSKKPSKINVRGVKKIIAVASGKGGVGKSTVAAGLACALAAQGLKIGLLDADIYGPSIPKLMGLEGQKPTQNENGIVPLIAHNVAVMSIGFMVDESKALIWRGPMVQSAFKQLLADVDWGHDGELDILILDTPPGTGDVQLTLAQSVDVDGAIIVSTPQEVALADARKGVAMFQTLSVPIIGLIENMSGDVFGTGGGEKAAGDLNIPFLGTIPLQADIRKAGDNGVPELSFFEDMAKMIKERIFP